MNRINRKILSRLRQKSPHGLLTVRYFLFFQSDIAKSHRQFWLAGRSKNIPFLPWLLLEVWLWFRWCAFSGWREIFLGVKHFGPLVRDATGMSLTRQSLWVLRYSIGWCISPFELYKLNLVKPGADPLSFVFTAETTGFHNLCNKEHPGADKSKTLLQDKFDFANFARIKEIPAIETYLLHSQSNAQSKFIDLLPEDADEVFCKLRFGSRGKAAFRVKRNADGLSGNLLSGLRLLDDNMVEAAWQKICKKGEVMIQPSLQNHPTCAGLSKAGEPITVRIMTTKHEHMIPENAQLEIPIPSNIPDKKTFYVFVAINLTTGKLETSPTLNLYAGGGQDFLQNLLPNMPDILPYWDDIYRISKNTHENNLDLWAVAWDWVVTPTGPVLLEGNSNFGLGNPQMQFGGLIKKPSSPSEVEYGASQSS